MFALLLLAACDKPPLQSVELTFLTPEPEADVCEEDLRVEVQADFVLDEPLDLALLAFYDDDVLDDLDVITTATLDPKDDDAFTLAGSMGWDETLADRGPRVRLVADAGYLGDLDEIETAADYDERVALDELYARATVTVLACP